MSALKCGCLSGFFMCPEAERLWQIVRIYAPISTEENNKKYKEALYNYDCHVSGVV